jgi:hypothetical protein
MNFGQILDKVDFFIQSNYITGYDTFRAMFELQLTSMGMTQLDYKWMQDRTQKSPAREKQPDECFFPSKKVDDNDWPRLVVETGKTQTTESLEETARWWLLTGGELIAYVILFDIDMPSKTITVQKWENMPATTRRSGRRAH